MDNGLNREFTYEEGYQRLEQLVESLEQGKLPLEASFQAFEQAASILKRLNEMLDIGEKRVMALQGLAEIDITGEA